MGCPRFGLLKIRIRIKNEKNQIMKQILRKFAYRVYHRPTADQFPSQFLDHKFHRGRARYFRGGGKELVFQHFYAKSASMLRKSS